MSVVHNVKLLDRSIHVLQKFVHEVTTGASLQARCGPEGG